MALIYFFRYVVQSHPQDTLCLNYAKGGIPDGPGFTDLLISIYMRANSHHLSSHSDPKLPATKELSAFRMRDQIRLNQLATLSPKRGEE
jgi:hypothetical protein